MQILINENKIVITKGTIYPVNVINDEWVRCTAIEKQGYMVSEENCIYLKEYTLIEVENVPDYVQAGKYIYEGGTFKLGDSGMTNQQLREYAYENMLYKVDGSILIVWDGAELTVDQANKKWLDYSAEGNAKADELSALIMSAKTYIRKLYPANNPT